MKVGIIYLGNQATVITHYREILNFDFFHSGNYFEIAEESKKYYGKLPLIIFIEKSTIETDKLSISYLKEEFPAAYLVLVTDKIEQHEIFEYQQFGISDTSPSNVYEKRLRNGIDFVYRNQDLIISATKKEISLTIYCCPTHKRVFDIVFSSIAVLILLPVLIITIIAIFLESKGPVIYKSKRVGSNYRIFNFYKFRSMYKDSDKRIKEFIKLNQYKDPDQEEFELISGHKMKDFDPEIVNNEELLFYNDDEVLPESIYLKKKIDSENNNFVKFENDPRITKVGRIIRKLSIDELPQLINIFKGDMSVVGNRPLPLYEAEKLTTDQYIDRFMGPSGLTGLWQVEKRGDSGRLSPEERKQLDVYYAKNYSMLMDIRIIFKTFFSFVQKENV